MEMTNPTTTETRTSTAKTENKSELARRTGETWVTPPVDILESEREILLVADVPGVRADDLHVELDKETLTFVGRVPERAGEPKIAYRRSFALGRDLDLDGIVAEIDAGVLKLHVPRRATQKARQIPVRST
jgi:HSP20 family molecular chaperone IbpA